MAEEARLTIRINPEKRQALKAMAKAEGKNTTDVLMEFIDQYIGSRENPVPIEHRLSRIERIIEKLGELAA